MMLGTTAQTPEIRHATGFVAPDPVVFIHRPGTSILVVSSMEYGRARNQARGCTVESPDTLCVPKAGRGDLSAWVLATLDRHGIRAVRVPPDFPLGIARALEARQVTVAIDPDSPLRQARMIKTEEECRHIRHAQRAARAAMQAAGRAIAAAEPGRGGILRLNGKRLTAEGVRAIIRRTVISFDCIDEGTIVAGGRQAADPHEAGTGPLRAGEWIVCDIFPRSLETGYWGDMTRTFMNGRPTPEQKRMYDAVQAAHDAALARIAPGVSGADVHAAAVETLKRAGYATGRDSEGRPFGFIHSTGHGVGLEIHEAPRLGPKAGILRENMVVTVEPGLYLPDVGGIRIEDLVVIQAARAAIL